MVALLVNMVMVLVLKAVQIRVIPSFGIVLILDLIRDLLKSVTLKVLVHLPLLFMGSWILSFTVCFRIMERRTRSWSTSTGFLGGGRSSLAESIASALTMILGDRPA
jgi:hypothetical protein